MQLIGEAFRWALALIVVISLGCAGPKSTTQGRDAEAKNVATPIDSVGRYADVHGMTRDEARNAMQLDQSKLEHSE